MNQVFQCLCGKIYEKLGGITRCKSYGQAGLFRRTTRQKAEEYKKILLEDKEDKPQNKGPRLERGSEIFTAYLNSNSWRTPLPSVFRYLIHIESYLKKSKPILLTTSAGGFVTVSLRSKVRGKNSPSQPLEFTPHNPEGIYAEVPLP